MSKVKRTKIIWALDPYGEAKIQSSAAKLADSLNRKIEVEVVYVHGSSGFPVESDKKAIRFGLSRAEEKIQRALKELNFKPSKNPKILALA